MLFVEKNVQDLIPLDINNQHIIIKCHQVGNIFSIRIEYVVIHQSFDFFELFHNHLILKLLNGTTNFVT